MKIMTISEIARMKGVTRQAVQKWVAKNSKTLKTMKNMDGRVIAIEVTYHLRKYIKAQQSA